MCAAGVSGCAFVNFSANYYTPPAGYQLEVRELWQKLNSEIAFKGKYTYHLVGGSDADRLNGIPAISGNTVLIPNDFVKYVYQNYYDDRFKILAATAVHEICHAEFGLPSRPPSEHFKTDVKAIGLLGGNAAAANDFCKSLFVVKDYWFARKGVAGHALNAAWNTANAASLALGGPARFADLFATDLSERISLIVKGFHLPRERKFSRSVKQQ